MFYVHPERFKRVFDLLNTEDPAMQWHDLLIDRELILDYRMPSGDPDGVTWTCKKLLDTTYRSGQSSNLISEEFGRHNMVIKGYVLPVWRPVA